MAHSFRTAKVGFSPKLPFASMLAIEERAPEATDASRAQPGQRRSNRQLHPPTGPTRSYALGSTALSTRATISFTASPPSVSM